MNAIFHNDILIPEYVPMEFPEVRQYIPEIPEPVPALNAPSEAFVFGNFRFNPVQPLPHAPDMSKGKYSIPLARAAFKAGVPYPDILE